MSRLKGSAGTQPSENRHKTPKLNEPAAMSVQPTLARGGESSPGEPSPCTQAAAGYDKLTRPKGKGGTQPSGQSPQSWTHLARSRHGRRSLDGEPTPGGPSPRTQAATGQLSPRLKGKAGTQPSGTKKTPKLNEPLAMLAQSTLARENLALALKRLRAMK